MLARQLQSLGMRDVEAVAQLAQRRQLAEAGAETLYPPALMVHRHQQRGAAQRMDLGRQGPQLGRVAVIAGEQDHAADQRVR